jgi:predicted hydrocarbon binding protein
MTAEASGKAFLGIIRYLKDNGGANLLKEIIDALDDSIKKTFLERIELLEWYPYNDFSQFLNAIKNKLAKNNPKFFYDLGEYTGKRDMETFLSIYTSIQSPERFIRNCKMIWSSYYRNSGEMSLIPSIPDKIIYRIDDFPQMNINHCHLMEGWIATTLNLLGFAILTSEETHCMNSGDPYHEFVFIRAKNASSESPTQVKS